MSPEGRAQTVVNVSVKHGLSSPRAATNSLGGGPAQDCSGRLGWLVFLGPAQCQHQLRHDGDGDLLRRLGADIEADRAMDAGDFRVAEAGRLEALLALGMVAIGTERADVETGGAHGELQRFVVNVTYMRQRNHRGIGIEANLWN